MKIIRRILLAIVLLLVIATTMLLWLAGTPSGTRWLLAYADAYLPPELTLDAPDGSLLSGLSFGRVRWQSGALDVDARNVDLDVEIRPLLQRSVIVTELDVDQLIVAVSDAGDDDDEASAAAGELPVDVALRAAAIRDIDFTSGETRRHVRSVTFSARLEKNWQLQLRRFDLYSDWLELAASADLELGDGINLSVHGDWLWKDDPLRQFEGQTTVDGTAEDLAVVADIDVLRDGRSEAKVHIDGSLQPGDATRFDLAYTLTDADLAALERDITGSIDARGRVAGTLGDDGPVVDIRIDALQGQANEQAVSASATGRYANATLEVSRAQLDLGTGTVRMTGTIGKALIVDAEFELPDVATVLPEARGSLAGTLALRKGTRRDRIDLAVDARALAWRDREVDSARLFVSGQLRSHTVNATVNGYEGTLTVEAEGGFDEQTWSGTIEQFSVAHDRVGEWSNTAPSRLRASSTELKLDEMCLVRAGESPTACVSASLLNYEDAAFAASLSDFPLAALTRDLAEEVTVSGTADGRVTGTLVDKQLVAEAELELLGAVVEGTFDDEQVVLTLEEARGSARLAEERLDASLRVAMADDLGEARAQLGVDNVFDERPTLSGTADVAVHDASPLAAFVPGISRLRGSIAGNVSLAGSPQEPEILGEIDLTDGGFLVRQAGIEVTDVGIRLSQLAPGQVRLHGSARSGDGYVSIEGNTQLGSAAGIRSEAVISGEDFLLLRLPDWQVAASPQVRIVFEERVTRVTGEIAIPLANITVRDVPETAVRSSHDTVVHRQAADEPVLRRRIDVDINASLGDDVSFAGFGLSTRLSGGMRLRGGTGRPYTGDGNLSLVEGRYKAYGQELEIERGELIFNGPLDQPLLDVRAIRRTPDVIAGIQLSGTPARLQSTVFSEPSLSDADALSYLLTGKPLAGATSGEGDTLNRAAFALGLSGAGSVVSQVRTELGLETLAIEGIGDSSRLVAGKRLGERLVVEYGYGFVDKLGTLLLRYQLNDRLMLESRTGTVSNLDIVYRRRKK